MAGACVKHGWEEEELSYTSGPRLIDYEKIKGKTTKKGVEGSKYRRIANRIGFWGSRVLKIGRGKAGWKKGRTLYSVARKSAGCKLVK